MHPRGFFLACLFAVPPILAPAAETSLADALPAETFFYASFDAAAAERGIRGLDLAKLLRDPEVAAFLEPLLASLGENGIDPADPVGSALAMAPTSEWLRGEASIGLAGFEITTADGHTHRLSPDHPLSAHMIHRSIVIENGEPTSATTRFAVDGLISCRPGPSLRATVEEFLDAPPPEFTVTRSKIAGRSVTVIDIAFPDGKATRVFADLSGERWLIGGCEHSFVAALSGDRQDSLARSRSFQRFRNRLVAGENALFAMFDAKRLVRMFRSFLPPIAVEEAEILGLDTIDGLGVGLSFTEGGVRESILLAFDGPPRGLLSPLSAFSGGFRSLDVAPASTAFFAGLKLDLAKLFDSVKTASGAILPNESGTIERELAGVEVFSLNLVEDLIPTLGDEISLALAPSTNPLIPDALFTLELRDPAGFAKILEQARAIGAEEGVEFRPVPLADGREGFSVFVPGAPVQPAFVVDGRRLIGAVSGYALKSVIARNQGKRVETLADDPGLASLRRGLAGCSPDSAAVWLHVDLAKVIPAVYEFGAMALPAIVQEEGLPLDPAQLPLATTIVPYLKCIAITVHCDEGGISIDTFSPMGLLGLAGVAGAIAEQGHEMEIEFEESDGMVFEVDADDMGDEPVEEPVDDPGHDDGSDGDN